MHARVGDLIEVDSNELGGPRRHGRILAVRGEERQEHYDVEWDDGHQSVFFPASTTHVVRSARPRGA